MFDVSSIGKYYPVKSSIHSMSSTAKITCLFLFLITQLITSSLIIEFIIASIILWLMVQSHIPLKLYLKSLVIIGWILLILLVVNFICFVGMYTNLLLITKILLVVMYTSVLTYTTPPTEITYGLEEFLKPLNKLNLPTRDISLTITLLLRFIPTVVETADGILKTQASRGIDFKASNARGKILIITSIIKPMFVLSYRKVKALQDAYEVRLYNYSKERNNYRTNSWKKRDTRLLILHSLVLIICILREVIK